MLAWHFSQGPLTARASNQRGIFVSASFDQRTVATRSAPTLPSSRHANHPAGGRGKPVRNAAVLAVVGAHTAAGEVLSGQDFVLDSYDEEVFEPSHDLRELAAAQLQSMFQVLARVSPAHSSSCRACVYARRAESLGAPQICLQRVACWPPRTPQPAAAWSPAAAGSSSSSSSSDEMDDVLTLHRPAWESGSGGSSGCDTEASLCQEEVVLLPNSNMLVLPLSEAGVLVGLLVVEVAGSIELRPPTADTTNSNSSSGGGGGGAAPPWGASGASLGGLSDDALWCLRMSVPPLAKACAMDLRAALAGAQQQAQQQLARSLLLEARGPLKVLGTFGQMLAPRLRAERGGQPESDMAEGMVMQGQRLAEVVAQLEAALAAGRGAPGRQQLALPGTAAVEAAAPGAGAGFAAVAGPPLIRDEFFSDDESDDAEMADAWQPGQRQEAPALVTAAQKQDVRGLPSATAVKAGYQLPEHCSSSTSSSSSSCVDTNNGQQQQQVEEMPHLPGQWTARSLESSTRSIRWGSVQPEVSTPARSATSSNSNSSSEACSAYYSAAALSSAELDMQKTIDLEPMRGDEPTPTTNATAAVLVAPAWTTTTSSSSSSNSGVSITSSRSSSRSKPPLAAEAGSRAAISGSSSLQGSKAAGQQGSCNLIDALSHLLTAAANLANVQGVNFIVNDPLQLDHPVGTPSAATSSSNNSSRNAVSSMAPAMQQDSSSSSSDGCLLLPRPIRPLLVGLAAGTCRRVLGYVLDVALQCTPRGGQLCVTARQCSGGVEVSVMHTGQVQPGRLHTTSKTFAAAVQSSSSSSGAVSNQQQQQLSGAMTSRSSRSAVKAAPSSSSKRSSRGMQELTSFGSLRSSSSLVSLDFASHVLQTIGGRLSVVYPTHFMNAISGQLEVGSSIEVWLPPPAPGSC